jgi:hypothetical protein
MARNRLHVLILTVLLLSAQGCTDYQNLPLRLYIDTDFSAVERLAIEDAIERWNDGAGRRYAHGDTVFAVSGLIDDDFDEYDYGDRIHAIYRINDDTNPDVRYLQEIYEDDNGVGAYCPMSDMFIVMYLIDDWLSLVEEKLLELIDDGRLTQYECDEYLYRLRFEMVQSLAIHEFGHMLGLLHYNHREGVMNSAGPNVFRGITDLSAADIDAFCLIYDCHPD